MTARYKRNLPSLLIVTGLRTSLGLCIAAGLTLAPRPAVAQSASDSATAQALFDRAKKLLNDGKYAEACPMLEESQRIDPRSGTVLNLADCYEHTGRLASAWSSFLEAATLAKASDNPDRESVARERAAGLVSRLSNLVISAPGAASTPGLEITRDGQRVGSAQLGLPLPADAGAHIIAATAPGRKPWQAQVTVKDAASTTTVAVPELDKSIAAAPGGASTIAVPVATPGLPPQPVAPAPLSHAEPTRTGAIVGTAVTGALLIGTGITSVLYNSKRDDYNAANASTANSTFSTRTDLHSQAKTLGAVNLALVGGTVVAAGVTVFLWTRPATQSASARVELRGVVSPGLAGLSLSGRL